MAQDSKAWTNHPTKVGRMSNEPRSQRWQRCRLQCCNSDGVVTHNAVVVPALLLSWRFYCNVVVTTMLRRCGWNFCFFFYSTASGKKMTIRKKKKNEIRNMFPSFIGWHNTSSFLWQRQLPSTTSTHTPSSNSTNNSSNSNNNSRTYKQKKSVAFNMKHKKWSFSRIELNYKEGMKMYVDSGRVLTTVNI
jgi:hypothetical protein